MTPMPAEVSPTRARASSVAWTLISSASPTSVQQTIRSRSVALRPYPARFTSCDTARPRRRPGGGAKG